jgi:hypothetical protein
MTNPEISIQKKTETALSIWKCLEEKFRAFNVLEDGNLNKIQKIVDFDNKIRSYYDHTLSGGKIKKGASGPQFFHLGYTIHTLSGSVKLQFVFQTWHDGKKETQEGFICKKGLIGMGFWVLYNENEAKGNTQYLKDIKERLREITYHFYEKKLTDKEKKDPAETWVANECFVKDLKSFATEEEIKKEVEQVFKNADRLIKEIKDDSRFIELNKKATHCYY